ncbi:MAG: FtsB family cell division protein [Lachnospiraceae bacterium]
MSRLARKESRRKNKVAMLCIVLIVFTILGAMFLHGRNLNAQIIDYAEKESTLQEQIDQETTRTTEIDEEKEYMQTHEYAEEVARNKLGMVKDNELYFKQVE